MSGDTPDYAASAFTQELIDEITRGHYRLHAWQRFLSRSWARSLDDIRESPARARSSWLWASAIAATGSVVVLVDWLFHGPGLATGALLLWLPWYAVSVFFILTHLGMADDARGMPYHSLLLPNGLSFLRLALAPLVLAPCLSVPAHPITGPVFALFLAGLSASDGLDGWFARRRHICTRLGRMLDPLADLALLTFLAIGLYLAGAIPGSLLWLLIVRYPFMAIGALVLYFVKGPAPLNPTTIGKVTTFATSIVLLAIAVMFLVATARPPSLWVDWSVWCLHLLIGANILYLIYRGVIWKSSRETASEMAGR